MLWKQLLHADESLASSMTFYIFRPDLGTENSLSLPDNVKTYTLNQLLYAKYLVVYSSNFEVRMRYPNGKEKRLNVEHDSLTYEDKCAIGELLPIGTTFSVSAGSAYKIFFKKIIYCTDYIYEVSNEYVQNNILDKLE